MRSKQSVDLSGRRDKQVEVILQSRLHQSSYCCTHLPTLRIARSFFRSAIIVGYKVSPPPLVRASLLVSDSRRSYRVCTALTGYIDFRPGIWDLSDLLEVVVAAVDIGAVSTRQGRCHEYRDHSSLLMRHSKVGHRFRRRSHV